MKLKKLEIESNSERMNRGVFISFLDVEKHLNLIAKLFCAIGKNNGVHLRCHYVSVSLTI